MYVDTSRGSWFLNVNLNDNIYLQDLGEALRDPGIRDKPCEERVVACAQYLQDEGHFPTSTSPLQQKIAAAMTASCTRLGSPPNVCTVPFKY